MLLPCQTAQGTCSQQNPDWCFTPRTQLQVVQEFASSVEECTLLPACETFPQTVCTSAAESVFRPIYLTLSLEQLSVALR